MFSSNRIKQSPVGDFRIDKMMRYSAFIPRLVNLCQSFSFEKNCILPSRAFCSDESQGFPVILITKHFGTFPFNHGRVGGIVATDRNEPHAEHGKDLVIIQASHVGYDNGVFGLYCRLQTTNNDKTDTCGKIADVIPWYQKQYETAQNNILLNKENDQYSITIARNLIDSEQGLFLNLSEIMSGSETTPISQNNHSTTYFVSDALKNRILGADLNIHQSAPIGNLLTPEMFGYRRQINNEIEGFNHLESNLFEAMPWIVSSDSPLLTAAMVNTQVEFERNYKIIMNSSAYKNRKLLFISCLNIDISPKEGQLFPLTKCVPWAAFLQSESGGIKRYNQSEIIELLENQSEENPNQIDLEVAIQQMIDAEEIKIDRK